MLLKDNYMRKGMDLCEAVEEINKLKNSTEIETVKMKNIVLMQAISRADGSLRLASLTPGRPYKTNKNTCSVRCISYNRQDLINKGWNADILEEAEKNGMFMKVGRKLYPVSNLAYTSLAMRAGITGPAATQQSLSKNMLIAENFNQYQYVNLVKRKEDGNEKVFAVMSNDYKYIRQDIISLIIQKSLLDLYDLGVPTCSNWEINQSFSRVYLKFPERSEEVKRAAATGSPATVVYTPGIMMETSDIGDSAFRVASFIEVDGNIIFTEDSYEKIHTGNVSYENVINYSQENIFPKLTVYPSLYAKLDDLYLYNAIDIDGDMIDSDEGLKNLVDIFQSVMSYCGLTKTLGKKRIKKAETLLVETVVKDTKYVYTAFDLLMFILYLAKTDFCRESKTVRQGISAYVHKIINYDFKKHHAAILAASHLTSDDEAVDEIAEVFETKEEKTA